MEKPDKTIRVVLAKLGCDIHERGALSVMHALRDAGMEVIYTGRYQTPETVVKVAIEEDADVLAISDSTGSMRLITESVLEVLEREGATDICVVAGGLIPSSDIAILEKMGVTGNFGPGTPLDLIVVHVEKAATRSRGARSTTSI